MKKAVEAIKFSIVIPVYNREKEIIRAYNSCNNQNYSNFEIIIVDDFSTDKTIQVVESFKDDKIVFIKRKQNGGVYAARKSGVEVARGQWIVFLDSDDELLPDALKIMHDKIIGMQNNIYKLGFMYKKDNNELSPSPEFREVSRLLKYEDYLKWTNDIVSSDYCMCIRRDTFSEVPLPTRKSSFEALYHLNFSKKYNIMFFNDIVAKINIEALNRDSNLNIKNKINKDLNQFEDGLEGTKEILLNHGMDLKKFAPNRYKMYREMYILFLLLAKQRREGLKQFKIYSQEFNLNLKVLTIVISGFINRKLLAFVKAMKNR